MLNCRLWAASVGDTTLDAARDALLRALAPDLPSMIRQVLEEAARESFHMEVAMLHSASVCAAQLGLEIVVDRPLFGATQRMIATLRELLMEWFDKNEALRHSADVRDVSITIETRPIHPGGFRIDGEGESPPYIVAA